MTGIGQKRHVRPRQILCVNITRKDFIKECPSRNGYFVQSLRYAQILILEIFLYIPVVKIFPCLDLEQNISFLDGH